MTRTNEAVAVGLLLLMTGCKGDGGGGGVDPLVPSSLIVILSKVILAAVGETTQALAEVRDQNGNVLAGQSVTWSSSNLSVAEVSSSSPISGIVTARGEGTSVITATAGSASGAVILQVQQQPAALEKVGGDGQTGVVNQALPVQPEVLLTDAMGSPVPNRAIQFSVTGGGGSVDGSFSTGQDGRASARWTLGVLLGSHRMRAAFAQFSVEFSATGVAGPAVSITKIAGDGQAGVVLTTLAFPLVVKLVDALGNPSVGVTVEFSASVGSVSPATSGTDEDGLASTSLTFPATVGPVTVTASAPDLGLSETFTATSLAAAPAVLQKVSGDGQVGVAASALPVPFVAKVEDASGNPVPAVLVTFATSSGSVSPVSVGSDANGLASTVLTLPATAGTTTVTVSTAGVTGTVAFTAESFLQVGLGASLTVGNAHNCARAGSDGAWYCWGSNVSQQLGPGPAFSSTPLLISGVTLMRVSAGGGHTCGLDANGEAYCWGLNSDGQLGDGTVVSRSAATKVSGSLHFVRISAGEAHTCALDGTGAAYCWGQGTSGQLGNAGLIDALTPVAVAGLAFQEITAGKDHTCAVALSGVAYCWGLNDQGQLGIGTQVTRTVPVAVVGGILFSNVSAGTGYSCGVTQAGAGYCWGEDLSGSLGAGGAVPQANPTPTLVLGGHTFTGITAGGGHTCGLVGGLTYCWGLNASGELGISSMINQSAPFLLPAPDQHGISLLLPGIGDHTCGLNGLGEIYCWGLNGSGQVGVAAGAPVTAPVIVPGWPR